MTRRGISDRPGSPQSQRRDARIARIGAMRAEGLTHLQMAAALCIRASTLVKFIARHGLVLPREAKAATDPHVEDLCDLLHARSAAGLAKYGTDLTRGDLTPLQWLQHMREELCDAALYCGRLAEDMRAQEAEIARLRGAAAVNPDGGR